MKYVFQFIVVLALLFPIGCAHRIKIAPSLTELPPDSDQRINKNVGYYISPEDLAIEVITAAGGGDKVKYLPYKESEPALKKVLENTFQQVHKLNAPNDTLVISQNNISYVFTIAITTNSFSTSVITWPPTRFICDLDCTAVDASGAKLWRKSVRGEGNATFDDFIHDYGIAGKRAVKNAFELLQREITKSGVF